MKQNKISIIIPTYNSEKFILKSLGILETFLVNYLKLAYEVIIVLDGPSDNTSNIVEKFVQNRSNFIVLEMSNNRGKGAAIREAVDYISGVYVFFMDADMSTNLEAILNAINILDSGADIVIGSRYHYDSIIIQKAKFQRRIISKIVRLLTTVVLRLSYSDTQCGFKGFRYSVFRELLLMGKINRFTFDIEMLINAREMNLKVFEIPVIWNNNKESTVQIKDIIRSIREILFIIYLDLTKRIEKILA